MAPISNLRAKIHIIYQVFSHEYSVPHYSFIAMWFQWRLHYVFYFTTPCSSWPNHAWSLNCFEETRIYLQFVLRFFTLSSLEFKKSSLMEGTVGLQHSVIAVQLVVCHPTQQISRLWSWGLPQTSIFHCIIDQWERLLSAFHFVTCCNISNTRCP